MAEHCRRDPASGSLRATLAFLSEHAAAAGYMDVADWANNERNGYRDAPPVYRHSPGAIVGYRAKKGWCPVPRSAHAPEATVREIRQSISHIEHAIAAGRDGTAHVHLSAETLEAINSAAGLQFAKAALAVDLAALQNVVRAVTSLSNKWSRDIRARAAPIRQQHPSARL
ncbi:MAG: hypothetical protein AAGF45_10560 [Pseudomonadota bacterium]